MKIFCVGRNYVEHAKELGNAIPDEPVIFMKPKSALLQTNVPFYYPEFTNELHYEAELVFQICKNGKYIKQKDAPHFYNKITVGIDFTARDIQNELKKKGLPWEKAKAWDQSAVVGKWLPIEKDMMKKPIEFSLFKNNEQVQLGNTTQMIYTVDYLIAHISNYFSLNIGDLIFTGTPAGVGECVVGDELTGYLGKEKMFELTIK
ncbi:fumarylacetoacetate hydrolase family protein [Hydrotalea sandarakina]|jgi:2-keto-4-pentenoate hydratase/2-oxohepta-3-ene-1,7-dioic acid hydratase in catechol pathway|uniref:2-keto-4-pentenoate hydratase/2-oxohepta-3-ene-1,7-dioic acid hydratase in catechol pathway n=1 Tax=Hydrotalea sandarakina TaxID=1004304 RepID=A0A2W7SFB9_9BACT|nr:fumarylacetoacetate hydrolase family protein [Hydrotalea sandarakina]PZX61555.1 2-keto-4-pentenoate hydratase/2-oxohepta-3-ene-1,7-dioic acid hydratase in catechol pathway [Hydrotalea sandarakina]